jgi:hypothetical protein
MNANVKAVTKLPSDPELISLLRENKIQPGTPMYREALLRYYEIKFEYRTAERRLAFARAIRKAKIEKYWRDHWMAVVKAMINLLWITVLYFLLRSQIGTFVDGLFLAKRLSGF